MYPPHHYGGYELACRDVVDRWRGAGHEVQVLTSTMRVPGVVDDGTERPDLVSRRLQIAIDNNQLLSPPLRRRRLIEHQNQSVLRDVLGRLRPDVVSVWAMGAMSTGLLTTLHRHGMPLVYVVSDDWPTYAVKLDPWMRLFTRLMWLSGPLERLMGVPTALPDLGRTGTFCFISQRTRERCSRNWAFPDATVTWSGIDLVDFPLTDHDERRPWSWRLISVGRLDPRKGTDVAIRALAVLPPEASLQVFSPVDDPYRGVLESVADEVGVRSRVTFATASRSELRDHYRRADALVFPTIWDEPFGYVPLEAMACGTPVVATASGGSGEFLLDGVTCVRCAPGDPASLAAGVERLAADPALRERIVAAGRATAGELSVDRFAEVLETWHLAAASGFAGGRPPDRRLPDQLV
jgi:glycosyltransferase involved in cell wall biosynthesis